jgi:hypothetical protein
MDAMIVKQALQVSSFTLSSMGGLVHELKELLNEEFSEARVIHVPRECNKVLARSGSLNQNVVVFDPGSLPDYFHVLVTSDLSGSRS